MKTPFDIWYDTMVLWFIQCWYTPNFIIGNADNVNDIIRAMMLCNVKKQ